MLDHAFLDTIAAVQTSFEVALLERAAGEEQFQSDLLMGDLSFDTSYTLPGSADGRAHHASIAVDAALLWNTFSQSALRSVMIGEEPEEAPVVGLEITFRVRHMSTPPEVAGVLATLQRQPMLSLGGVKLAGPRAMLTTTYSPNGDTESSILSVSFDEEVPLQTETIVEERGLEKLFADLGGWCAAQLVALSDYPFSFASDRGAQR